MRLTKTKDLVLEFHNKEYIKGIPKVISQQVSCCNVLDNISDNFTMGSLYSLCYIIQLSPKGR